MDTTVYPPGPRPRLAATLALRFVLNPLRTMESISRRYGDISYFKLGPEQVFLVNRPDYIKDVLVTHSQNFVEGRGLQAGRRVIGEGLLTSDGEIHNRQRRLVLPAFNHGRLASYAQAIVRHSEELPAQAGWREGLEIDVHKEMTRLTLEIVGETLFDADLRSDATGIGDALTTVIRYLIALAFLNEFAQRNRLTKRILQRASTPLSEIVEALPLPANLRFFRACETLDTTMRDMIRKEQGSGAQRCRQGDDAGEGENLLALLLHQDGKAESLDAAERQARDIAMTILLAGHETTANVLTWTWYLLAKHPDIEARLHDELDSVLGERPPTFADLSALRYTKMVLSEAMRLYPPVWVLGRKVVGEYKMGDYVLPSGSSLLISQYVMHRDPRYFKDPERFRPERWSEQRSERTTGVPEFAYFPFSRGPRSCIGESFAWLECTLLLAAIARKWEMRLVPGHPVVVQPLLTLRPRHGVLVKLRPRHARHSGRR